MRADRLLAMLMLLQTHRRLTAQELAEELEVSERTIYRDVVALSSAGIPITTESGPGGGIALIENYQTNLTGLNPQEVQALSMLNIPEPLVRLGVGQALKAALLKLGAAIPPATRQDQAQVHARIHLDATWWFQDKDNTPHLDTLKHAVWQDRLLHITYQGDFNHIGDQIVAPYGLVAKTSLWYLVYAHAGCLRVRRISRILSAEILPQTFTRPPDFDLAGFWKHWCSQYERERPSFRVQALVAPLLAERIPKILQNNLPDILNTPPTPSGKAWKTMVLRFESFEDARTRLLGFGGAVEVLEPQSLRRSMADYACQIQERYAADVP